MKANFEIQKEVVCTARQKEPLLDDNTIKEVVKQKRRERPEQQVQTESGDNSKYLRHNMEIMSWSKPDVTNKQAVSDRIYKYFALCEQNDMKPSVEGLALAFDTTRKTLWCWVNGVDSSHIPDDVRNTLKKSYALLNSMMADYMQNGKINPVSGIFLMKNNMGYADQTEIVVTPNNPLGEVQDPDTIAEKYKYLPTE